MFDIGFWELSLIAVIALLILGPERLPSAARQAGLWAGKVKKMVSEVKSNINEELRVEELNALKKAGQDLKDGLQSTQEELGSVEREMKRSADEITSAAESVDIASAIKDSSPVTEDNSTAVGDVPSSSAPASAQSDAPVVDPKMAGANADKKEKPAKPVKTASSDKASSDKKRKSGGKSKKPKRSGKKNEKAGT
jgi:sec-independent protein translocase protein TatB